MIPIRSLAVFCGSRKGHHSAYEADARALGTLLAQKKIELVFGAGHVGLMGMVADACLETGGKVVGYIPRHLVDWELAHPNLTELVVVQTMHERKAGMAQRVDAFVALPGGFGTCDEFFEILTWKQLRLHGKPIGLLNTRGFFEPMLNWIDLMIREGFLKPKHKEMIAVAQRPEDLLPMLEAQINEWEDKIERA